TRALVAACVRNSRTTRVARRRCTQWLAPRPTCVRGPGASRRAPSRARARCDRASCRERRSVEPARHSPASRRASERTSVGPLRPLRDRCHNLPPNGPIQYGVTMATHIKLLGWLHIIFRVLGLGAARLVFGSSILGG